MEDYLYFVEHWHDERPQHEVNMLITNYRRNVQEEQHSLSCFY